MAAAIGSGTINPSWRMAASLTLALGYLLDLGLGDPVWLPHPVRGLGWVIDRGERFFRGCIRNEILGGALLVVMVGFGTFAGVFALLWAAQTISYWMAFGLEVALLYTCLSTKDLAVESWPVYRALRRGDLQEARSKVAMIVGRDTKDLSQPEVVRATVETIGESIMDGIVAPLFYAALGGVPCACLYKTVNTLDSMIGYRSARYIRFGRVAAKIDSWMNWVPARITSFLIALGGKLTGFSGRGALRAVFRDAWRTGENSFLPEAALGGALGVRLGGVNFYQGMKVETPLLGDPRRSLDPHAIAQAIRVMYASSLLAFGLALGVQWLIG